ncbi:MAG: PAS domain S-box protein, partial [Smithellaceae bacterium]|nr:PAS domain S-box protein [Smithellaceae bacterium]
MEKDQQKEYVDRKKFAFSDAESKLISQVFLNAKNLNNNIVRLHELTTRAATTTRNRGIILIILFIVGSTIAIATNSIIISRIVERRLTALYKGLKIIGGGNLDYHIDAGGDDELSDLAHASNEMVMKLKESQEFAESVINTVREPLISLNQDLRVVSVSRSFCEFFKVKPEDTVGQLIYDLGNKQWDIPKLRELLENILPKKVTFDNYEVEHDFTGVGRRIMLLNARQIERASGKERIILLAIEDITERK